MYDTKDLNVDYSYPSRKIRTIGAGVSSGIDMLLEYLLSKEKNEKVRVTMYDKNASVEDTTATNIAPSLTIDELLSVVPSGEDLVKALQIFFNESGGIRVDIPGIYDTESVQEFIAAVIHESTYKEKAQQRQELLYALGKLSMQAWEALYEKAKILDPQLATIFDETNFNFCGQSKKAVRELQDGYRIDLIYDTADAATKAANMCALYQGYGYDRSNILSPREVRELDPALAQFCVNNAIDDDHWQTGVQAVYRPGGSIDMNKFLPKLYEHLANNMGVYRNDLGEIKSCFRVKYNREVRGFEYDANNAIKAVKFVLADSNTEYSKPNKHHYENGTEYLLVPGENTGFLRKVGIQEPPHTKFAGASLALKIPVSQEQFYHYRNYKNCMEVHKPGVVLAWQLRTLQENEKYYISIKVGGTKALYGDVTPNVTDDFAKNRHLLQLRIINDVVPDLLSLAFAGVSKSSCELSYDDLQFLVDSKIAKPWVGSRSVAYSDGASLGSVFTSDDGRTIANARIIDKASSGGVSFAPGHALLSRFLKDLDDNVENSGTNLTWNALAWLLDSVENIAQSGLDLAINIKSFVSSKRDAFFAKEHPEAMATVARIIADLPSRTFV
jgi:hypothetical protein